MVTAQPLEKCVKRTLTIGVSPLQATFVVSRVRFPFGESLDQSLGIEVLHNERRFRVGRIIGRCILDLTVFHICSGNRHIRFQFRERDAIGDGAVCPHLKISF